MYDVGDVDGGLSEARRPFSFKDWLAEGRDWHVSDGCSGQTAPLGQCTLTARWHPNFLMSCRPGGSRLRGAQGIFSFSGSVFLLLNFILSTCHLIVGWFTLLCQQKEVRGNEFCGYRERHVTKRHAMHLKWRCSECKALAGHFREYVWLVPNKVAAEFTRLLPR